MKISACRLFVFILAVAALPLSAENSRGLTIAYNFASAVPVNDEVRVRILVRVINGGSSESAGVVVRVMEAEAHRKGGRVPVPESAKVLGDMAPVTVRAKSYETTQGMVTVGKAEFQSWSEGRQPVFVVEIAGESGVSRRQQVQSVQEPELTEKD